MLLWAGLGNPEPGMAGQRHNIGFMAIEAIAGRHGFSPWKPRFKGVCAEGTIAGRKILALKPMTYMNDSGEAVRAAAGFFRIPPPAITVFHDELDLAPGRLRVKQGGGAAGHNGLRSLDRHLATPEYWRVRLGIGHPGDKRRVLGHVLQDFDRQERVWLLPWLDAVAEAAPLLAEQRMADFMTRLAPVG